MAKRKLDIGDEHQSNSIHKKRKALAQPGSAPEIHSAHDIQALLGFYQDNIVQLRDGTTRG